MQDAEAGAVLFQLEDSAVAIDVHVSVPAAVRRAVKRAIAAFHQAGHRIFASANTVAEMAQDNPAARVFVQLEDCSGAVAAAGPSRAIERAVTAFQQPA